MIPFARTASFWLAYIFTSVAILAQLPLMLYAFTPKEMCIRDRRDTAQG